MMTDEEYMFLAHGHTGSCAYVTSQAAMACNCQPKPDHDCAPLGEVCHTCQNREMEASIQELHDRIREGVVCLHCGEMPCTNKNVQFSIQESHDPYCAKWVPHCDCHRLCSPCTGV